MNRIINTDYPNFSKFVDSESDYNFNLKSFDLISALKKTAFATRDKPSRYQMNGILFESDLEGNLNICATDTKRLAHAKIENFKMKTTKLFKDQEIFMSFIIYPKLANFIIKYFCDCDIVSFKIFGNKIFISSQHFEISAKLVQGVFPDFKKATPICDYSIVVNRLKLIKALNNILPFTSDVTKSIGFSLRDNKISLSSCLPESGQAEYFCNLEENSYFQIEASFNPNYFIEGLKAICSENVLIEMKDERRPFILISATEKYLYLLMPVLARE